jgi:hypothetical protein
VSNISWNCGGVDLASGKLFGDLDAGSDYLNWVVACALSLTRQSDPVYVTGAREGSQQPRMFKDDGYNPKPTAVGKVRSGLPWSMLSAPLNHVFQKMSVVHIRYMTTNSLKFP